MVIPTPDTRAMIPAVITVTVDPTLTPDIPVGATPAVGIPAAEGIESRRAWSEL